MSGQHVFLFAWSKKEEQEDTSHFYGDMHVCVVAVLLSSSSHRLVLPLVVAKDVNVDVACCFPFIWRSQDCSQVDVADHAGISTLAIMAIKPTRFWSTTLQASDKIIIQLAFSFRTYGTGGAVDKF